MNVKKLKKDYELWQDHWRFYDDKREKYHQMSSKQIEISELFCQQDHQLSSMKSRLLQINLFRIVQSECDSSDHMTTSLSSWTYG